MSVIIVSPITDSVQIARSPNTLCLTAGALLRLLYGVGGWAGGSVGERDKF